MSTCEGLTLHNDVLSLRLLPELGARIVSLRDLRTGREWLLPSQLPGGVYRRAAYGADFGTFDTSGFDDCFPCVSAGPSPDGRVQWPDHGELWSRPWEVTREGGTLCCTLQGVAHPYTFTRRLRLEGDTLHLHYTLDNHADTPFPHLWSAHPLLAAQPGMRLLLPESLKEVFVNGGTHPDLGAFGDRRPWPEVAPGLDLSRVPEVSAGLAVKLFTPFLAEGHAALLDPTTGEALHFQWDPREIPHLGLWLCYGGWPTDGRPGHLTVALEPCTGAPDDLAEAAQRGWCPTLPPRGRSEWTLSLRALPPGAHL